jgi:chromosome segregation ATPase
MSRDVVRCFEEAKKTMNVFENGVMLSPDETPAFNEVLKASRIQLAEIWGDIKATMSGAGSGESPSSKTGGGDSDVSELEKVRGKLKKNKEASEKLKSELNEAQKKIDEDADEIKRLTGDISKITEKAKRDVEEAKKGLDRDIEREKTEAARKAVKAHKDLSESKGTGPSGADKKLKLDDNFDAHANELKDQLRIWTGFDLGLSRIPPDDIEKMKEVIKLCKDETYVNLDGRIEIRMQNLTDIIEIFAENTTGMYEENDNINNELTDVKRELSEKDGSLKTAQRELSEKDDSLKTANVALGKRRADILNLKRGIKELQALKGKLEANISSLESGLASEQGATAAARAYIVRLQGWGRAMQGEAVRQYDVSRKIQEFYGGFFDFLPPQTGQSLSSMPGA